MTWERPPWVFVAPGATTVPPLELFWGLWLFPLGILAHRSGFLPRWLGVWLLVNGGAYVALSFVGVVAPGLSDRAMVAATPALFGEAALMLWLLIRGAPETAPGGPR